VDGNTTVNHLRDALTSLRAAENSIDCTFCRGHVRSLRILCEDLIRITELGEEIGQGEVGELARRVGNLAERLGALSVLGRLIHRIKGLR
jgi:hypothetical protein